MALWRHILKLTAQLNEDPDYRVGGRACLVSALKRMMESG